MKQGLIILAFAVSAIAGCTSNPQTNREIQCAGGVVGGAALGGLIGNQIGGGTGEESRDSSRRGPRRRGGNPDRGLPVGPTPRAAALTTNGAATTSVPPGASRRHMAFPGGETWQI